MAKRFGRRWVWAALGVLAVGGLLGVATYRTLRWKKFAVVAPGAVYRSGQLPEWQFVAALERFRLKTVVCLNSERAEAERKLCAERGVDFRHYVMPSDGLGRPEQFAEVLSLLRDPTKQPVLVHCNAGVARTGASVALYRQLEQGWDFERAVAELATFERLGRIDPALKDHIARLAAEFRKPGSAKVAERSSPNSPAAAAR